MSSKGRKIGLRYAKAFVSASLDVGALKSDLLVLEELEKAVMHDVAIRAFFLNPVTEVGKKIGLLDSLFADLGASKQVVRLLNAVLTNNRIFALTEIVSSLKDLSMEKLGIVRVSVRSARELAEAEKKDIEKVLESKIQKTLSFCWSVDASLIGGLVVSYEGVVIDASLEGRLKGMEKSLLQ